MFTNPLVSLQTSSRYRWLILMVCALTPMLVITLPNMSLPPLFATISEDLGMSLVEIGIIWGIGSFTGIFFALIGGTLGDRFGARALLFVTCFLTGLFGLTRAFAVDFSTLLLTGILFGVFQAIIPVILFKTIRHWFPPQQLGTASGVIAAGFATGLMLGPLLSTSVILPALGGWRQVLAFYGVLAIMVSFLWLLVHPAEQRSAEGSEPSASLRDNLRYVTGLRDLWILGIAGLGIAACFQGFSGYLPTYLKSIGWGDLEADRALAAFFVTSLLAVIPLSILSDKFRLRRSFLIFASLVISLGIGLIGFVEGSAILLLIAATGLVFDSFMAISSASVLEVEGVTGLYTGTAVGFTMMIRNLGGTFSPAIGNSLTGFGLHVPFLFWSGMGLFAVFMFVFVLKSAKHKAPHPQALEPIEPVLPEVEAG